MNIEKFSECCLAKVCREDGHVKLTICCILREPGTGKKVVHRKEVMLDNLIAYAQNMLARYHQELHGQNPQVSGAWDELTGQAEEAARRMGEARLVRSLFSEVSPMLASGDPSDGDSGMYQQAHRVLVLARDGNPGALDTMAALMNAAYRGNARALEIMMLMRDMNQALDGKEAAQIAGVDCSGASMPDLIAVGSWWKKFKKAARGAARVAISPVSLAVKAIDKVPGLRYLNKVNPAAWAVHALEGPGSRKTRVARHQALPPAASPQPPQPDGNYPDQQDPDQVNYPGDPEDSDDYSEDDVGEQVAGWLYNKPYRTVAETVVSKFPGLGISLRELYQRGQDSAGSLAIAPLLNEPHSEANVSGVHVGGLSWHGLMRKAKNLAHTVSHAAHEVTHNQLVRAVSPILAEVAPIVANAVPGGGMALSAAMKAHDILVQAKKDHPEAVKAIAAIRKWADEGDPKALEVAKVMKGMSDKLDEKAAEQPPAPSVPTYALTLPTAAPLAHQPARYWHSRSGLYHRGLGHQWLNRHLRHMHMPEMVGGWLFNKPYRGVLAAPGFGVSLREMYNRGEGRQPTSLVDILKQLFPLNV